MNLACLEYMYWEMEALTSATTLSQQQDEVVSKQSLYGLQGGESCFE